MRYNAIEILHKLSQPYTTAQHIFHIGVNKEQMYINLSTFFRNIDRVLFEQISVEKLFTFCTIQHHNNCLLDFFLI